jgi:hypothetical protein
MYQTSPQSKTFGYPLRGGSVCFLPELFIGWVGFGELGCLAAVFTLPKQGFGADKAFFVW